MTFRPKIGVGKGEAKEAYDGGQQKLSVALRPLPQRERRRDVGQMLRSVASQYGADQPAQQLRERPGDDDPGAVREVARERLRTFRTITS